MDSIQNPFSPGAGAPPPSLAGRGQILEQTRVRVARTVLRKAERGCMLVGLRGVGKTVLLQAMLEVSEKQQAHCIKIEAHEAKPFTLLLLQHLHKLLLQLKATQLSAQTERALRVFKSFLNTLKVKYHEIEFSLDIKPEQGSADSGDLDMDLPILVEAVAQALQEKQSALVLLVDELQYLSPKELGALILTSHLSTQKQLPFLFMGAGLPQLMGLMGKTKSYAERLFVFSHIEALAEADARLALEKPLSLKGVQITPAAMQEILNQTKGYPYFLQTWGYYAWSIASGSPIDRDIIKLVTLAALESLDESFFRVRFDRLTPREKKYLRVLAEFGTHARSGEVAQHMGYTSSAAAPIRNNLIKKGMIYSPAHGDTEFTVPLFDAFMKRIMPIF